MSISDIKLYAMNVGAIGVTTFTQIEDYLKVFLLLVTIGYTLHKWVNLKKEKDE
jgi:hypothetical protein